MTSDFAEAPAAMKLGAAGAQVMRVAATAQPPRLDLPTVLRALSDKGITRLMVEGGSRVAASFVASGLVDEGMTVDFGAGPRLNYWLVMNGQKIQYSGTAQPTAFTGAQNDPARLAGKLRIDDTAAGGPRVEAEVDVGLTKEFTAAR